MDTTKYIALIPCAGVGARLDVVTPKQYIKINGRTILEHTISAFVQVSCIDQIVVVVSATDNYIDQISNLHAKVKLLKVGGKTRAETVINGLKLLECCNSDWVLVHDAARCCITPSKVVEMIDVLKNDAVGGILAMPATDTVKKVEDNLIRQTLIRDSIYLAQTPQMFQYKILLDSLLKSDLHKITDEANAVEQCGLQVRIITGDATNIKVTYPMDIKWAQIILDNRQLANK